MKITHWIVASTFLALFTLNSFGATPPADTAKKEPAQPAPKSAPKPAHETEREVAYDDLDKYMGQRVIVHSTFGTTRSGKLTKHSITEINISLDDNNLELTVIRTNIRSIGVPVDAQAPATGDGSAKKN